MTRAPGFAAVILTLLACQAAHLAAQADSVPPAPAPAAAESVLVAAVTPRGDTLYARAPVSPMGALWRSILLPGWGQAKLNRKLTGALFVAWEGVTLGMAIKSNHELGYLRRTNSGSVKAKEKERQDWLVLLAFNHLFSAIEAYVGAHLWDFPPDLDVRAAPLPGGGTGIGVSIPVHFP
ncbi:MAG: hypothetical protein IPI92_02805 [Gemmatimonadetes bacterium]|nr:hypothetical protein [Gemmatimonadota bacterium]MBK7783408.1 hypothetical protein [Gemmatimonadota bacterium]